ncbi:DNA methyltransferase [Microbulbifer rhizosphaerae]|uniref:site-specific DNA-methyltransferase (adenine-specific) n=1 Tax=Microbulbifer rhizosphaerae TaxID=1562603 RepID=A0A7W4WBA5_9GAMM|nr:adenine-specific DNA-methyltransferase [Microbulbifer rhizosphaerae]
MDPDTLPKVQQLKTQLSDGFDLAREEGEVYDALVTFFNRYYDEGDFLSRRVYKDGTYAIPYQGEEVVLHWANKDQYYIKSSETLRDYSFRLNPHTSEAEPDPLRVHFKLVDAEAGAQNNNKESDNGKRVFILDAEQPFELIQGEPNEDGQQFEELQIRFVFRAATQEDWNSNAAIQAELAKATAAAKKKPPVQGGLVASATAWLLSGDSGLSEPWRQLLAQPYTKANGEQADYSRLQGQLNNYTKKNSFDYFIHKDLGGFLNRELDFYIKNELLDWADLASLKNNPTRLAPLLSKIEVIRKLGESIIAFLAQLENFQKKLWLKKKFVTETNYCITLDRLAEHTTLLEQVFSSEVQLQDWQQLYKLDLAQLEKDYTQQDWPEFLAQPQYRYLMLDTRHFDETFKAQLLATIEDLDAQCDGLLVHSENFQALNLLQERYREQVKCIYIDPPYNTGGDGFAYKDQYQHSTWLSMIRGRLGAAHNLLSNDGVLFSSIDGIERPNLEQALNQVFGEKNHIEEIIWVQNTTKNQSPTYSTNHEYIEVFSKNKEEAKNDWLMFREGKPGYKEIIDLLEELNPDYPCVAEIELALKNLFKNHKEEILKKGKSAIDEWKGIYNYNRAEYRDSNGKYVSEDRARTEKANIWVWREDNPSMPQIKQDSQKPEFKDPNDPAYRFYQPIHPTTGKPCPSPKRGWSWPLNPLGRQKNSFNDLKRDHRIAWGEDDNKVPQTKRFLHEVETNVAKSTVIDFSDGEKELTEIFGKTRTFAAPKPTSIISRFVQHCNVQTSQLVLDFFSGSGTTGHAVMTMNQADFVGRKFLLIEMGSHFDAVLKPRLLRIGYTTHWKGGKPQLQESGLTHCFKYLRLESYEDTLGNLALHRGKGQQELLQAHENSELDAARQSYVMNYMLEVETRGSASLLNTKLFTDPTAYKLDVRSASGDETKAVRVDLLETFNYLLGLTVEHIAAPLWFDAEVSQGEYGRWQAQVSRVSAEALAGKSKTERKQLWWFRTVYGTNRAGQKVLVVWRNLPSLIAGEEKGLLLDNAVLDAVLIEKLNIRLTQSADDEVDILYVNGDHNIAIPKNRHGEPMEEARLQLIEEAFHRLMFAGTEAAEH